MKTTEVEKFVIRTTSLSNWLEKRVEAGPLCASMAAALRIKIAENIANRFMTISVRMTPRSLHGRIDALPRILGRSEFHQLLRCLAVAMVLSKGQMSARVFRAGRASASRPEEVVQGKTVFLARHDQEEQKESQAGNDVLVERVQRLLQEVAERDDDEHNPQGQ
jgi:hypothetical protein